MLKYKLLIIFIISFLSAFSTAQSIEDDFFQNPSFLPQEVQRLVTSDLQNIYGEGPWKDHILLNAKLLKEKGLLPSLPSLVQLISKQQKDANKKFYQFDFSNDVDSKFYKEYILKKHREINLEDLFKLIMQRLRRNVQNPEQLETFSNHYEAFLSHYATLVETTQNKISLIDDKAAQLIKEALQAPEAVRRSSLDAALDSFDSVYSLQEKQDMLEDPDSIYKDLVNPALYRDILRLQEEASRTLSEDKFIKESLQRSLILAKKFNAIEDYEEPLMRSFIESQIKGLSIVAGAIDKNPAAALQSLGEIGLSIYDDFNGGPPEEQRHNEIRKRLKILAKGQQLILQEIANTKRLLAQIYSQLSGQLDSIRYIVGASQKILVEQGLTGLRDCEQFTDAKKHYVVQDKTGPRIDLGYASYEAMRSQYAQIELNRHFGDCVEFLKDATFKPEGLSLLSATDNLSEAQKIAQELGQDVDWLERQLTDFNQNTRLQKDYIIRLISPAYLQRFLGAFSSPSKEFSDVDQKLKLMSDDSATFWQQQFQKLALDKNLERFFNPYLILKISESVQEVQPFRLLAENAHQLYSFESLIQENFSPLDNRDLGNTAEQRFDHHHELIQNTARLVAASLAQQNFYSGDLLLPLLAISAMSPSFERWANKSNNTAALELILKGRELYIQNSLLRKNLLNFKIHKTMLPQLPSLDDIVSDNPRIEGENDTDYEKRLIEIMKDLGFATFRKYIEMIENVIKISNPIYQRMFADYLEQYRRDLPRIEDVFRGSNKVQKLYVKHTKIDVLSGRPSSDPVNKNFFKKRWEQPRELLELTSFVLDIDDITFANNVLMVEQEKELPDLEKYDRRSGSHLRLPLRANLAKERKNMVYLPVNFPSLEEVNQGRVNATVYQGQMSIQLEKLRDSYNQSYLDMWKNEQNLLYRRHEWLGTL